MTDSLNAFAHILQAGRARYNAKFAEARWRWPKLAAEAFADLLRTTVAPAVEAVDRQWPDKTAEVAEALYDLALDLLGKEFIGPLSRYPLLTEEWNALLPPLAKFVAQAPRQFVGSVTNALYNLSTTAGARPHEWSSSLLKLAEVCPDAATLLKAGQVAAWRAGLAHYRLGALEICRQLAVANSEVARAALGLPPEATSPLDFILDGMSANPWLTPLAAAHALQAPASQLKIVARVGAFRGFGGEFLAPPVVVAADGRFVVRDGEDCWQLTADVFGATLHRIPPVKTTPRTALPEPWKSALGKRGLADFLELQAITSLAADDITLAVTTSLSHGVRLLTYDRLS